MAGIDWPPQNWTLGTGPLAQPTTMGWRCPQCGAVWSPTTTGCLNCTGTREASGGCTCASGWPTMCPAHNGLNSWFAGHAPTVDFIAKGHFGTPCPKPREGGMCGCDEDDEPGYVPPPPCRSSECTC